MLPAVVHVLVGSAIGGAERLVVDLSRARGHHVVALQTPNPALVAFFREAGVPVEARVVPGIGGLRFLANTFAPGERAWLVAVAKRHGARLFHAHTFQSHLLAARAAAAAGLPHVRTEHHVNHWEAATSAPFSRAALRTTRAVAAISEYVSGYLRAHVPLGDAALRTIANGVDGDRFATVPPPPAAGPLHAVMTCRLEAWKRVDLAIAAVAAAPGVRLSVAGEGPESARLSAQITALGVGDRVRLVGHMQDTRELLARGHVVLSTSEREPFGLAVAEGMAAGRPALAIRGGGVDEVVGEDGGGALLEGPTALAEALRAFDPASAQGRGEAARARIVERFGRPRMLRAYEDFWSAASTS